MLGLAPTSSLRTVVGQWLNHWELVICHSGSIYIVEIYKHCKLGFWLFGELVFQHSTSGGTHTEKLQEVLGAVAKVWMVAGKHREWCSTLGAHWAGGPWWGGGGCVSIRNKSLLQRGCLQPETLKGQLGKGELTSLSRDTSSDL